VNGGEQSSLCFQQGGVGIPPMCHRSVFFAYSAENYSDISPNIQFVHPMIVEARLR
jgi:hypothetical protein